MDLGLKGNGAKRGYFGPQAGRHAYDRNDGAPFCHILSGM
jgi:hypothetical protein